MSRLYKSTKVRGPTNGSVGVPLEEQQIKYNESLIPLGPCPDNDDGKMYNDKDLWHATEFTLPTLLNNMANMRLLMYAAAACYEYGLYAQLLAAEIMNLYETSSGKQYIFRNNGKHWKTVAQDTVLQRAVIDHHGIYAIRGFPLTAVGILLQTNDYTVEEQQKLRVHIDDFKKLYDEPKSETSVVPGVPGVPRVQSVLRHWLSKWGF